MGSCQVGKCKLWPAAMCSPFSDRLLLKEKDASGPLDERHSGTSNSPEVTTTNAHDTLREVENTPVLHQKPGLRELKVDRFRPLLTPIAACPWAGQNLHDYCGDLAPEYTVPVSMLV